ncbi:MAG: hypothetical protein COT24_00280 [Candidatus Kerfeldbacteria bacterium CG08_land_8_20_14_0_20_40_16]|uniref:PpiC domain-containing protein n=1 Tax=Candidatus Kerfeldbacteria bacterium CG08_land_8_20_14_0_20_40_16 TaxID=2014244 RepID=A0A2H0YX70_9BACT|nr:MAG: hypothetical protein COT24_00280 [Candidatus Kerfeldbacteria bacterium CG08_land_8_20_14_0_20_40_16]
MNQETNKNDVSSKTKEASQDPKSKSLKSGSVRKSEEQKSKEEKIFAKKQTDSDIKEKSTASKKGKKKVITWIIILVLIVIIGALTTIGVGLYRYDWNDKYTNAIIKVIPYPVALVNWQIVKYSDFRADLDTLRFFYQKQQELYPNDAPTQTETELKDTVLNRLIEDELVIQLAKQKNVTATQEEIDQEFQLIIQQAGSQETLEQTLQELYQWNVDQFKSKVLYPFILRRNLEKEINSEADIDAQTKAKAQEVLDKVKAGEQSFEDLAQQYSEDSSTSSNGGDLGYFGRGEMVSEFEEAAFALNNGEVSDLIKTDYGYHIIKVEEKVIQKDEAGNDKEVVHTRHILIRYPAFDEWLGGELENAQIFRLVKI